MESTNSSNEHTNTEKNHTTADILPEQTAEAIERYNQEPFTALKGVYDVDGITELRQAMQIAGSEAYEAAGGRGLKARFAEKAAKEQAVAEYLVSHGIDSDSSEYKRSADDMVKFASIPDYDWYGEADTETGEAQPNFRARLMVGTHLERRIDAVTLPDANTEDGGEDEAVAAAPHAEGESVQTSTPESEADASIEAAEAHLSTLRTRMAELTAKRQSRLFTLQAGKLNQEYEAVQAEYNSQIQTLGKLKLAETLADESASELDKNKEVIAFLFDEQGRLREESTEVLKNSTVSKAVEWLNRGNALTRIGKGALVGVAAAAAGTLVGTVAGVAGVAAAGTAVAAGVVGAARFARGFARSDAKKGRGMESLADDHKEAALASLDAEARAEQEHAALLGLEELDELVAEKKDVFDAGQEYFTDTYEADTKAEQKKRRRSVAAGIGGIALGAGAGIAVHTAIDAGIFDGWGNRLVTGEVSAAPEPDADIETPPEGDTDADSGETVDDATKQVLDQQEGDPAEYAAEAEYMPEIEYDPAFAVESGEGGIAFFQSLGLSEADWYAVAPELAQNFPQEFYSEGGDVRFMQPGNLSLEAQNFIKTRFGLYS